MATVNLLVKSKQNGTLATIYLRFRDGRETDITVPTYLTVDPQNWSNKTQGYKQRMITPVYTQKDKEKKETEIKALKEFVGKAHSDLRGDRVTREWIIDAIHKFEGLQKPKKTVAEEYFSQYIKRFVDEAACGKRLANAGNTKKKYSYGSLRVLRGFMLSFEMFCEDTGKQYNFNDINIDFYNDFIKFFYERNCGANYIGKHIKSLKTIMRQAREEGLHNNMEIERKAFKTISEEVEHIYLTEAELKALFELDLAGNKVYEVVRDVFLAGCYTAQRYSDYSQICKENIKTYSGNKVIELIQAKTGEKCIIPIRPELEVILKRYDYTLPKTFEQKVNENIKKVGALAGITELIHVEKNKGGLIVKTDIPKCDLIQTHTARRTGCSLMYLAGIPIIDIMKISGHRTPKEFLKYIRIGKEETAVNLARHPYFTQRENILKAVK